MFYILFILAILFILLFRIIPYLHNSVPLGYDAGIYKYAIEHGLRNLDNWLLQGTEPGFLYFMQIFRFLSTDFILKGLLIFFCLLLGISVYFTAKEYSNKQAGLIALFVYAFSIVQFKTFWYLYYKNILGMILILNSILFLKKYEKTGNKTQKYLFIIFAGLIGAFHRPSFYIFGLSYLAYAFISPIRHGNKNKLSYNTNLLLKNIVYGLLILVIFSLFYLGKFSQAITIMFEPVLQGFLAPGESAGTFINFFAFQFSSLFYLPIALLGLLCFIRKRDLNILVIWALINLAIVYFQFFFFNRFIIFLDLALAIMACFGFSVILKDNKKIGSWIIILLIFSAGILAFKEAKNAMPLISESELQVIKQLNSTEQHAYVMATSSIYSPWVLGYSNRKTIAPGLFDYNKHNKSEWLEFWTSKDISQIKRFLGVYPKPLYIFIGEKQKDNLASYDCFENIYKLNNSKIYKVNC